MHTCPNCGQKNSLKAEDAFDYFNSDLMLKLGENEIPHEINTDPNLTYPDNPKTFELSESIYPPVEEQNAYGLFGFIISLFIAVTAIVLSFFYGDIYIYIGIGFTALAIFFHYLETKLSEKQSAIYEKESAEYDKKFVCLSCGQVYDP